VGIACSVEYDWVDIFQHYMFFYHSVLCCYIVDLFES